jgi:hypothetical protein
MSRSQALSQRAARGPRHGPQVFVSAVRSANLEPWCFSSSEEETRFVDLESLLGGPAQRRS